MVTLVGAAGTTLSGDLLSGQVQQRSDRNMNIEVVCSVAERSWMDGQRYAEPVPLGCLELMGVKIRVC